MAQWTDIKTMTVKMPVNIKADGYIATKGTDAAATKQISINGISTACTIEQATAVFDAINGTIGGQVFDSLNANRTMSGGVE